MNTSQQARRAAAVAGWIVVAGVVTTVFATDNVKGLLAAVVGALILVACWGRPRVAFVVWTVSITMVPIWVNIHLFATLPLYCIVAIIAIAATVARSGVTITRYDVYFGMVVGVALIAVVSGGSEAPLWAQLVIRWGIPFVATRVLLSGTGVRFGVSVVAIVFGVIGGLAVIEFLSSWHPFVNLYVNNAEFGYWHDIQTRGGRDRSEWAFGHSIALGGALALSIPFIARATFPGYAKAMLLVAVAAGVYCTASRGAVLAAVFTAALCLLGSLRSRITRIYVILGCALGAYLLNTFFTAWWTLWTQGGSNEERVSFNYRNTLYSSYLSDIKVFGRSLAEVQGSEVHSVDSAILRLGLEFGWVFLVILMIPLVLSAVRSMIGNASFAEIALVGQLPLFASVALITQYESVVFVVAAFAVQALVAPDERSHPVEAAAMSAQDGSSTRRVSAHRSDR